MPSYTDAPDFRAPEYHRIAIDGKDKLKHVIGNRVLAENALWADFDPLCLHALQDIASSASGRERIEEALHRVLSGMVAVYVCTLDGGATGDLICRMADGTNTGYKYMQNTVLLLPRPLQTVVGRHGEIMVQVKGPAIERSTGHRQIMTGCVSAFYIAEYPEVGG